MKKLLLPLVIALCALSAYAETRNNDAIKSTVESLKYVYTIVLALSLGEAFKKVISDKDGEIHWDRLVNLIPFLCLIVPFFQGMNRYFYETYQKEFSPDNYAVFLFIDCFVFMIEGSLFFVLSRSLSIDEWRRFYGAVLVLLLVDIGWGSFVWWHHNPGIQSWVLVNAVAFPTLLACWYLCRTGKWLPVLISVAIIAARSTADYITSWELYFPKGG